MTAEFALLVVAKAPVPGLAKTRLTPPATPEQAAAIAAGALLDTLTAVLATPGARPVVALTGELAAAAESVALQGLLDRMTVFEQRGGTFAERLVHAHADTAARFPGLPVVQIGMDTPQVTPELLARTAAALTGAQAVLGPAEDGGWWALGLRDPARAAALGAVPMSRPDTAAHTRAAVGEHVDTAVLSDVDTMADAVRVAALCPGGRFAAAVHRVAR